MSPFHLPWRHADQEGDVFSEPNHTGHAYHRQILWLEWNDYDSARFQVHRHNESSKPGSGSAWYPSDAKGVRPGDDVWSDPQCMQQEIWRLVERIMGRLSWTRLSTKGDNPRRIARSQRKSENAEEHEHSGARKRQGTVSSSKTTAASTPQRVADDDTRRVRVGLMGCIALSNKTSDAPREHAPLAMMPETTCQEIPRGS